MTDIDVARLMTLYTKLETLKTAEEEKYNKAVATYTAQQAAIIKQLDIALLAMHNNGVDPKLKVDGAGVARLKWTDTAKITSRSDFIDDLVTRYRQEGIDAFLPLSLKANAKYCYAEVLNKKTGLVTLKPTVKGVEVSKVRKVAITKK